MTAVAMIIKSVISAAPPAEGASASLVPRLHQPALNGAHASFSMLSDRTCCSIEILACSCYITSSKILRETITCATKIRIRTNSPSPCRTSMQIVDSEVRYIDIYIYIFSYVLIMRTVDFYAMRTRLEIDSDAHHEIWKKNPARNR